jgi:hypothetical protein
MYEQTKTWLPSAQQMGLKIATEMHNRIFVPLLRWSTKDLLMPAEAAAEAKREYVQPAPEINPLLMLAALEDHRQQLEAEPENCQAILNACLASLRTESIKNMMVRMMGALVAKGYDPEEAMLRVLANAVMLGINMKTRLDSTSAAKPCDTKTEATA